jgi:histidyl-tRNA synthetase
LLGKYGEEGDQLIFRVLKRGAELGRALAGEPDQNSLADSGLRYDLTVPLARVVAEYRTHLPRIFKRYQIQPVYRADRPARGRFREFFQCDLDVVGSTSKTVEAEVLAAAVQVLEELGFTGQDAFRVRLNHRSVLRGMMEVAGVPPALEGSSLVAVDKLDKIGLDGVRQELAGRGLDPAAIAALLDGMDARPEGNIATLDWLEQWLQPSEIGRQGVADLRTVLGYCHHGPASARLAIDPYLARGLSYYTGPIFEVEFPGLAGSGGGGGRYDDLLGLFSGQRIPACGFSMGLERVILIMEERGMFPDRLEGQPQALVTIFDEATAGASLDLAHRLRAAGLRIDLYPDPGEYGRQFKYAESRGIRYAVLLSPREIEAGVAAVRDLGARAQEDVPFDALAAWLADRA